MPEATAIKSVSVKPEKPGIVSNESWIKYNDQGQVDFQNSVQQKLAREGINQDTVPAFQKELPIHVPTGAEITTPFSEKEGYVAPPDTFQKPESNLINHMMHGVDRTGESSDVAGVKAAKEEKLMNARNRQNQKSRFKIPDWFYDEDKKAA